MPLLARKIGIIVASLVLLTAVAMPEVRVGQNLALRLNGAGSFGYSGTFSDDTSNQLDFGLNTSLFGFYFDPKFLQFQFNPYYNQSRLNSTFSSINGAKGFTSSGNLFSGTKFPFTVSFEKAYNTEGQFNVLGSTAGLVSQGQSQSLNLGWSLNLDNLPTLQIGYGIASSSSQLLGSPTEQGGHSRVFSVGSGYSLLGFMLSGSFTASNIAQQVPSISDLSKTFELDSNQKKSQVSMTRHLPLHASLGASFSHSTYTTDLSGAPTEQTYDGANASLSATPIERLNLSFGTNYSTSLTAFFMQGLLPGSTSGALSGENLPVALALSSLSSDYFAYTGRSAFRISKNFSVDASYDHRVQGGNLGAAMVNDTVRAGLRYSMQLFGGKLGTSYNLSEGWSGDGMQSSIGHGANVSYSRNFGGWRGSGGFQFMRGEQTSLLSFTQSGWGFNVSASHKLHDDWLITLSDRFNRSKTDGISKFDSSNSGLTASIAAPTLSFSGSYSRGTGSSLQALTGLQQTPLIGPLLLPNLLVLYQGDSIGFSAAYRPTNRWRFTGDYSSGNYITMNGADVSKNLMSRYGVKSEYTFRQTKLEAGFSHISQSLGTGVNQTATVNAVYVGINRRFDVF